MPPRTATSPRFSTSSVRAYPAATRSATMSVRSLPASPACSSTGVSSPSPGTCGQALPHRVGAGREPLVRQRLAPGVDSDGGRRQQAPQRGAQILGLGPGTRDRQDGAPIDSTAPEVAGSAGATSSKPDKL